MIIILAFLLLAAAQANNYVLPVSITGYYLPESSNANVITNPDRNQPEVSYLFSTVIAITILSTVAISLDFKQKRIDRIYELDRHNIYFQPLPPIQEEDENEEEEEENPHIFNYVNPIINETCEDPC